MSSSSAPKFRSFTDVRAYSEQLLLGGRYCVGAGEICPEGKTKDVAGWAVPILLQALSVSLMESVKICCHRT